VKYFRPVCGMSVVIFPVVVDVLLGDRETFAVYQSRVIRSTQTITLLRFGKANKH